MRIPLSKPYLGRKEEANILRVLRSGQLAQGPMVKRFEEEFANYLGAGFASAVSNGTAALHLALLASKVERGDEVITTPFSFISTGNCIMYVGAKPIFVDIDPVTLNIDPKHIEERITNKTKAILVAHVFGLPCDMDRIASLCETYGLTLIEDCAEALGSLYGGRRVGTFGIGCFSFYPNKSITCGEGGMVCVKDRRNDELVKALRNQGRTEEGWLSHQFLGFNYRMTDLAAAIGIAQLKKIEEIQAKRKSIALTYENLLRSRLSDKLILPLSSEERSWFTYVIQIDDREKVSLELSKSGIETRNYFPCIHLQPPYKRFGYKQGDYLIAESVSKKVLALPFFTSLSDGEIEYVVDRLYSACPQYN